MHGGLNKLLDLAALRVRPFGYLLSRVVWAGGSYDQERGPGDVWELLLFPIPHKRLLGARRAAWCPCGSRTAPEGPAAQDSEIQERIYRRTCKDHKFQKGSSILPRPPSSFPLRVSHPQAPHIFSPPWVTGGISRRNLKAQVARPVPATEKAPAAPLLPPPHTGRVGLTGERVL